MISRLRTTTRPTKNGVRIMSFGVDVIGTVAAIVLAGFAAWVTTQRELATISAEARYARESLPNTISTAINDHDARSEYVTWHELQRELDRLSMKGNRK